MKNKSLMNSRSHYIADVNKLTKKEIYALTDDRLAYSECIHCMCRMCINMLDVCKLCFMCQYKCNPMRYCKWFVPFIFKNEPYRSYFRELEKLRGNEYDMIGRFD